MWSSGDEILMRRIVRGRVWFAHGVTVVQDDADALVLWLPHGAPFVAPDGKLLEDWTLRLSRYEPPSVLGVAPTGRGYSVFVEEHSLQHGWYVNLESRTRTRRGIDVDDHFLDLWVYPDGRWEWLDEDELEAALAADAISPETAAAARSEGERVLEEWPFPTGWEDWRPPPHWRPPALPAGWDAV